MQMSYHYVLNLLQSHPPTHTHILLKFLELKSSFRCKPQKQVLLWQGAAHAHSKPLAQLPTGRRICCILTQTSLVLPEPEHRVARRGCALAQAP
jgi:hypothetical protein